MESEVRQEVATEMRELLVQMENNYKVVPVSVQWCSCTQVPRH